MDILTSAPGFGTWSRVAESIPFPSNGYRGDYVKAIGELLRTKVGAEFHRPAAAVLANLFLKIRRKNKTPYIRAVITRCRELIGDDGFHRVSN